MTKTAEPQQEETPIPFGKGLNAKVAWVQASISTTLKQRHVNVETSSGGSYSYDYITEGALMREIRPLLAQAGLAVYYSDEIKTLSGNLASVRVALTVADGETGEERAMSAEGIGTDKGDKAVNKAKTSALRYLLWKWFLVPSDIDPETENVERSERQPRDQIKWATEEEIEAFLAAVEAGGFERIPAQDLVTQEQMSNEGDGVRSEWLAGQRRDLERAVKARTEAAAAAT